jgi:cytochrome c-type biogenesis protein CcmF
VELGWGGWWAWDPVENVALIPWLLLVVHLHLPRSHSVRRWAGLLVWPTVFAGTAMTRTSLRTSVHAFANAEDLGWFLWPIAAVVGVGAVVIGLRLPRAQPISTRRFLPVLIAFSSALVVALGTFRPFLPGDGTDGTFYSRYLWPVAIVGMVGLGVAPRARNLSRSEQVRLVAEVGVGALIGVVLGALAGWTIWWQLVHAAALGAGLLTTRVHWRTPRRTAAHVGMLFVMAGALGGTASVERTVNLDLGETVEVAGHIIENRGAALVAQTPPVIEADLLLDGSHELHPQLTVYAERALRLPEIATHSRPHEDVQAVLRSADDDGSIVVTINVEPLTQLVWMGAVLVTVAMLAPTRVRSRPSSVEPSAAR